MSVVVGLLFDLVFLAVPLGWLLAEASGTGPCAGAGIPASACDALLVVALLAVPAVRGAARGAGGRASHVLRRATLLVLPILSLLALGRDGIGVAIVTLVGVWILTRPRGPRTTAGRGRFFGTWGVVGLVVLLVRQIVAGNLEAETAAWVMAAILFLQHVRGPRPFVIRLALGLAVAATGLILASVALISQSGAPASQVASLLTTALALELLVYLMAALAFSGREPVGVR